MTEAAADPHLTARQTLITRDGVIQPGPAPRFSRTPGAVAPAPPRPGQNTAEALTAWGLADVGDLIAAGAAVQSD